MPRKTKKAQAKVDEASNVAAMEAEVAALKKANDKLEAQVKQSAKDVEDAKAAEAAAKNDAEKAKAAMELKEVQAKAEKVISDLHVGKDAVVARNKVEKRALALMVDYTGGHLKQIEGLFRDYPVIAKAYTGKKSFDEYANPPKEQ
jgi:predicted transcriptional regulator